MYKEKQIQRDTHMQRQRQRDIDRGCRDRPTCSEMKMHDEKPIKLYSYRERKYRDTNKQTYRDSERERETGSDRRRRRDR